MKTACPPGRLGLTYLVGEGARYFQAVVLPGAASFHMVGVDFVNRRKASAVNACRMVSTRLPNDSPDEMFGLAELHTCNLSAGFSGAPLIVRLFGANAVTCVVHLAIHSTSPDGMRTNGCIRIGGKFEEAIQRLSGGSTRDGVLAANERPAPRP